MWSYRGVAELLLRSSDSVSPRCLSVYLIARGLEGVEESIGSRELQEFSSIVQKGVCCQKALFMHKFTEVREL